jgi:NitT/TauT family transport system permease protein
LPPGLTLFLGVAGVLVLLAAYTALAWNQKLVNPADTTIPSWTQLWDGFVRLSSVDPRSEERWIVVDSLATGQRYFAGFGASVFLGVLVGVLMGAFTEIEAVLLPPLAAFAKVVPTAAMAVFFVLVGLDLEMYVTMIVFGVAPSLAISVQLAAKGVPRELIDKAYTLGASEFEVVWGVIFPTILPKILDAVRLAIGPALVYLIAAEMLVGSEGYGYRIRLLQRRLDMNVVYLYIMLLAVFGFAMDYGLRGLKRWWCPWAEAQ